MTGIDPLRWRRRASHVAYDGYTRIRRDTYELPDESVSEWDVQDQGDTVAVVAFTPDEEVVLFEQFRVGPAHAILEVPGGQVDDGETPLEAGLRELDEETGYRPSDAFLAGSEWSGAGSTRRKHVVVAANATRLAAPRWGAHEMGVVRTMPASDFIDHLLGGDLSDAGESLRGLHVFAGASHLTGPLATLQARVRALLAASVRAASSLSPAADPFDEFWNTTDGRERAELEADLERLLVGETPAVAAYERASLHDFSGEEATAIPLYRAALDAGLDGDRRTAAIIQLASSLRNVGEPSAALAVLREVGDDDALADAVRAFEALALFDDDKPAAALRTALRALAPHLPAYRRAVDAYAAEIVSPARIRVVSVALVVKDAHVLAEEYPATAAHGRFLRAPGGGAMPGEDAEAAMRRELREELGAPAERVERLAVVENIFRSGRKNGHEIVSVFAVDSAALQALPLEDRLPVLDSDTTVGWYRLADLDDETLPFYPPGARELAERIADGAV